MAADPDLQLADAVVPWNPNMVYNPRWSPQRAADFLSGWTATVDAIYKDEA